jgi:hypothetical protein
LTVTEVDAWFLTQFTPAAPGRLDGPGDALVVAEPDRLVVLSVAATLTTGAAELDAT